MNVRLPDKIESEQELDNLLTTPSAALIESIKSVRSPLLLLGAGGKMGPTLALLAKRAAEEANPPLTIIAVSRFSDAASRDWLESRGVQTVSADLLDPRALAPLPDTENLVYLVGLKFGTGKDPSATWAVNTVVPTRVMERFPKARIVALSTGNVYPMTEISHGGSVEPDPLTPLGEYPNAAVARERIFEFFSRRNGTAVALIRLFYAVDLRYGVLVDLASRILRDEPVELGNGWFNCIWQGDANEMILRAFALAASPPTAWNLSSPEIFSVRKIAAALGDLMDRKTTFRGEEAPTALLANSGAICARLGRPSVEIDQLMRWTAHWMQNRGRTLNRPTHFEVRDGKY